MNIIIRASLWRAEAQWGHPLRVSIVSPGGFHTHFLYYRDWSGLQ